MAALYPIRPAGSYTTRWDTINNPPFGVMNATLRYDVSSRGSIQISGYNITNAYSSPWYDEFGGIPVPLVNGTYGATSGYLGTTASGNIGPAVFRIEFSQKFGG